jgi:hypothetical protein
MLNMFRALTQAQTGVFGLQSRSNNQLYDKCIKKINPRL